MKKNYLITRLEGKRRLLGQKVEKWGNFGKGKKGGM
jgi:hypothetical protein